MICSWRSQSFKIISFSTTYVFGTDVFKMHKPIQRSPNPWWCFVIHFADQSPNVSLNSHSELSWWFNHPNRNMIRKNTLCNRVNYIPVEEIAEHHPVTNWIGGCVWKTKTTFMDIPKSIDSSSWSLTHRIHVCYILYYGNIYHQYTPVMLAYIPAPWILWVMKRPFPFRGCSPLKRHTSRTSQNSAGILSIWVPGAQVIAVLTLHLKFRGSHVHANLALVLGCTTPTLSVTKWGSTRNAGKTRGKPSGSQVERKPPSPKPQAPTPVLVSRLFDRFHNQLHTLSCVAGRRKAALVADQRGITTELLLDDALQGHRKGA